MAWSRRGVLAAGVAGAGALWARGAPSAGAVPRPPGPLAFVGAATTIDGRHWALGVDNAGQERFRLPLPTRGHQFAVSPDGALLFAAPRRPGTTALVLDLVAARIAAACHAAPGRHFFGHAAFSADGASLFTTENDYDRGRGVVVVRETRTFAVVQEFDSGGIGPHELAWLPDGRTLAVANGGILTHPSQPRKKLNLGAMRPNLAFLDAASGRLLGEAPALDNRASIRHLAVTDIGEVVVGMQYEGPAEDAVPLVAVHRGTGVLEPLEAPPFRLAAMRQYTASVAVDGATGRAAATCPRGNRVTFWSVPEGRHIGQQRLGDAGGVAFDAKAHAFVATNGRGVFARFDAETLQLQGASAARLAGVQWDNHLAAVDAARALANAPRAPANSGESQRSAAASPPTGAANLNST